MSKEERKAIADAIHQWSLEMYDCGISPHAFDPLIMKVASAMARTDYSFDPTAFIEACDIGRD